MAEPIRIGMIMGKWVGGGVEAVVFNYYKFIDKDKVQFDFICDSDSTNIPYSEIESMGGKVILIPPYQKPIKYHKELKKVLKNGNYRIVHSHINTMSVFSLFAAKRAKIPFRIAHSHSTTTKAKNPKEIKRNLLKNFLKHFSKVFANVYFACSEKAGRYQFGNKFYDTGKVKIINNAIDVEKFKYDEAKAKNKRKELKINKDTLVVGHLGRFCPPKNHTFIIDIFYEIYKKNNNSMLLLAGQGPLMEETKAKVQKYGLQDNVRFLGQRTDANELYQVFDVFILPSLYEGLPVVGIEAQASGTLCFFSDEVTKEAKIIDSTEFLSLKKTSKEWANIILTKLKNYKKHDTTEEVTKYGFNIKNEVKKLEDYYISLK